MSSHCRCGECGRFTRHWKDDEAFRDRQDCWKVLEGPHIPGSMNPDYPDYRGPLAILPPRAILCEECADVLSD